MSLAKTILLSWDWEPSIIIGCAALAIGYAVLSRLGFSPKSGKLPLASSPGTPGEDRGGGLWLEGRAASEIGPHPVPPPEYQGRGKERIFGNSGHIHRFQLDPRVFFYYLGLAIMFLTLVSPLDTLADTYLFSMHMFQHLLLSEVVPALLLLGIPLAWWQWVLSWKPLEAAEDVLRKPPVAWLCGVGALWLWHWPRLYDAALYNENLHAFQHLCFMVTGTIFWYPVITPVPGHRMTVFPAVFYLFAACTFSSLLGIFITFCSYEIYPFYLSPNDSLGILPQLRGLISVRADQELGGLLMWFPCCLIYAGAILIRLGTWFGESPDESESPIAAIKPSPHLVR